MYRLLLLSFFQVVSCSHSEATLWGPYDVHYYLNLRRKDPDGLRFSVAWGSYDHLRHQMSDKQNAYYVSKPRWTVYDGKYYGHKIIEDREMNLKVHQYISKHPVHPEGFVFQRIVLENGDALTSGKKISTFQELSRCLLEDIPLSVFVGVPDRGSKASIRILQQKSQVGVFTRVFAEQDKPVVWGFKGIDNANNTLVGVVEIKRLSISKPMGENDWMMGTGSVQEAAITPQSLLYHQSSQVELGGSSDLLLRYRNSSRLYKMHVTDEAWKALSFEAVSRNISIPQSVSEKREQRYSYFGLPHKPAAHPGSLGRTLIFNGPFPRTSSSGSSICVDVLLFSGNMRDKRKKKSGFPVFSNEELAKITSVESMRKLLLPVKFGELPSEDHRLVSEIAQEWYQNKKLGDLKRDQQPTVKVSNILGSIIATNGTLHVREKDGSIGEVGEVRQLVCPTFFNDKPICDVLKAVPAIMEILKYDLLWGVELFNSLLSLQVDTKFSLSGWMPGVAPLGHQLPGVQHPTKWDSKPLSLVILANHLLKELERTNSMCPQRSSLMDFGESQKTFARKKIIEEIGQKSFLCLSNLVEFHLDRFAIYRGSHIFFRHPSGGDNESYDLNRQGWMYAATKFLSRGCTWFDKESCSNWSKLRVSLEFFTAPDSRFWGDIGLRVKSSNNRGAAPPHGELLEDSLFSFENARRSSQCC